MTSEQPTVTQIRTALLKESQDFYQRRKPHSAAMHGKGAHDAHFDAYEGLVAAGAYAEALAAILRLTAERHGEDAAADFAALVHDVMENGNDGLEDVNRDVWDVIDAGVPE